MSKIADDTYTVLKKLFPFESILPEYYVRYKNTRLFFDFYVKSLNFFLECDGEQHFKFVKHFHGSLENFYACKRRDNLKLEYCEENNLTLVRVYDKIDKISEKLILERIYGAMNE